MSLGTYKGVPIRAGENIQEQLRAIDAQQAAVNTAVPPRNELVGGGYNQIVEQNPGYDNNSNANPDFNSREGINNTPFMMAGGYTQPYTMVKTLSSQDSVGVAKKYGLQGIRDDSFRGLTETQAAAKAEKLRQQAMGQTSQLTSYSYNPETVSGVKKSLGNLQMKLQDTQNDPWNDKGTKSTQTKGLFESTANDIAKYFNSKEEFQNEYDYNEEFRKSIDTFRLQGGDVTSVVNRIGRTSPQPSNEQDLATYLAGESMQSPYSSPEDEAIQQQALYDLSPEKEFTQMEIMRLSRIPKGMRDLYFGTPEKIGVLENQRIQAEEALKQIAESTQRQERDIRAQTQSIIERNKYELDIRKSEIEESRLKAKNLMTQRLAQLGALQTTGAAVEALSNLDLQYEKEKNRITTQVMFANQDAERELMNRLNGLENNRDENITRIEADLSKSEQEVAKEIMKAESEAQSKAFDLSIKFAELFRTQTGKYKDKAQKISDKYLEDYMKIAADKASILSVTEAKALGVPFGTTKEQAFGKSPVVADTDKVLSVADAKALGVPYGTTEGQAYGTSPAASGSSLTATQIETVSGFRNTLETAKNAIDLLDKGVKTGPVAGKFLQGAKLIGKANPEQLKLEQMLSKLKADFVKSISGAAVSEGEVKRLSAFLPNINDQESVIKSKLKTLITETAQAQKNFLNTAGVANAVTSIDDYYRSNPDKRGNIEKLIKDNPSLSDDELMQIINGGFNGVGNTSASNKVKSFTQSAPLASEIKIPSSSRLAYVNNNPGNLRFAGQTGAVKGDSGFAKFPSPQAGFNALVNQINLDASRGLTLEKFISKFAPPSENNTSQYIQQVASAMGISPSTQISRLDKRKLAAAIAKKESSTKINI